MMDYAARVREADTYPKLLRLNAKEHGNAIALREKDFGLWRTFTWNDYQSRVHDFALGMVGLGLGRGGGIGIIGDKPPRWGRGRSPHPRHRGLEPGTLSRRARRGSGVFAQLRRSAAGIRRGRGA